jgi:hypothetical protein
MFGNVFYRNKDEFFRYIIMDVSLYHGCFTTLQSPIDSQPSGLNAMNRIRSVERRNGQMASVLWDARGTIFINYLEKGQTIKNEWENENMGLLERLNDEIKKETAPFEEKSAVSSRQ